MRETIVSTSAGILIMTWNGRKLMTVRFVDAAIAHYYTDGRDVQ